MQPPLRVTASTLVLALLLAACGGGGGETYTVPAAAPLDGPMQQSLAYKGPLTDDDIRHFLERTHFGFSESHYRAIQKKGLPRFLDGALAFGATPKLESTARKRWLLTDNDSTGERASAAQIRRWWIHMIRENANPLQESLALHWHDHFATSLDGLVQNDRYWIQLHVELLRRSAAGNVKQLALDVARDWAMLAYLDGNGNHTDRPNENFAREWFELFTLGRDNGYTHDDIVEASRAFTGYFRYPVPDQYSRVIGFYPHRHDTDDKVVLGQLIPGQSGSDDYGAVADITFATGRADLR